MDEQGMIARRSLEAGQSCVIHIFDARSHEVVEIYRTRQLALEAPNWHRDGRLFLNGDGHLWQFDLASLQLDRIDCPGLPFLNNDHVLAPDGEMIFVSACDWHIHRINLADATHVQVSTHDTERPLRHFLHGISRNGAELAFVGIEPQGDDTWGCANIFTMPVKGGAARQLTFGNKPADGCEYSPDGQWIYFNSEAFSDIPGHAQIVRIAHAGGTAEQLTFDERVNWFPHLSPCGTLACYLSYPPGTVGHPANVPVQVRLVAMENWTGDKAVFSCIGGQGTMNVNGWSPDGHAFAFISYPFDD